MINKSLTIGFMGLLAIGAAMYVPSAFGQVSCINPSTGTVTTVASVAECTTANHGGSTTVGKVLAEEEKQAMNTEQQTITQDTLHAVHPCERFHTC